MLLIW